MSLIYTTYFSKVSKLPSSIIPISIAAKPPEGWKGLEFKQLAPKWSFVSIWKQNHDNQYYTEEYYKQVLNHLNQHNVIRDMLLMAHGNVIALVCYERADNFCHRQIVAQWLKDAGYDCEEYQY